MKEIYWFESKQLDRVTNFSSRTEIIKNALKQEFNLHYYCSFKIEKKYFDLKDNIHYLGFFKNRILKKIEFNLLVCLKVIALVFKENQVIIVNQDLIKNALPGVFLNKILKNNNKFVVDIRTTPTGIKTFERDMERFHSSFKYAVKYFDGLSFITPFMGEFVMSRYNKEIPIVYWSSGVDTELFDSNLIRPERNRDKRFTVFYHGGISISRGNLNLIKACEELIDQGYDIKLQQIGITVDISIREYINSKQLQNWCELLPPMNLKDIPQCIANCDLPVLPFPYFMAWRVSSPIKLMEYLSMGKKVLVPKMEAFTDMFGNNENLVFYYSIQEGEEVSEIAHGIKNIIDQNLLYFYNKEDVIRFAGDRYTWEQQADNLLQFCQEL